LPNAVFRLYKPNSNFHTSIDYITIPTSKFSEIPDWNYAIKSSSEVSDSNGTYTVKYLYSDPFSTDYALCDMNNVQSYFNNGSAVVTPSMTWMGNPSALPNNYLISTSSAGYLETNYPYLYYNLDYALSSLPFVTYFSGLQPPQTVNSWAGFLNYVSKLRQQSFLDCSALPENPTFYTKKDSWGTINVNNSCQIKTSQLCTMGNSTAVFPLSTNMFSLSPTEQFVYFNYGVSGINCWDQNGDRENQLWEDNNGDFQWNSLDCIGAT
jgi:hypothetical protein